MEAQEETRVASDWGVAEIKTPTGPEICDTLFKQPPLKWSRITPFQDPHDGTHVPAMADGLRAIRSQQL
eukprot:3678032-Prymnesium_polylepis.1